MNRKTQKWESESVNWRSVWREPSWCSVCCCAVTQSVYCTHIDPNWSYDSPFMCHSSNPLHPHPNSFAISPIYIDIYIIYVYVYIYTRASVACSGHMTSAMALGPSNVSSIAPTLMMHKSKMHLVEETYAPCLYAKRHKRQSWCNNNNQSGI